MELERTKFLTLLKKLKPGLQGKSYIQEMNHFIFTGDYLLTYNDFISVFAPFRSDFVLSVKSDVLLKYMEKLTEKDVTITFTEDGDLTHLNIATASTEIEMPVAKEGYIHNMIADLDEDISNEEGWNDAPDRFAEGAYLCLISAAKQQASGTVSCLKFEGNHILSTDNHRATRYLLNEPFTVPFMIKAEVAKYMRGMEITSYKVTETWVFFENTEGIILATRRILGEFPDLNPLFIKNPDATTIQLPATIKNAIELMRIVSEEETMIHKFIKIAVEADKKRIVCFAEKEGRGKIKKTIPLTEWEGENITFLINPEFLLEVMERTEPDEEGDRHVYLEVSINSNRAYLNTDSFEHLIALFKG